MYKNKEDTFIIFLLNLINMYVNHKLFVSQTKLHILADHVINKVSQAVCFYRWRIEYILLALLLSYLRQWGL